MISKLLFNKEHMPERCDCKHKFHEMREMESDHVINNATKFVKESKKFRGGY